MARVEAVRLTPRLQVIADQIAPGARLADIGTDHAHLPIWLIENGRVVSANCRPDCTGRTLGGYWDRSCTPAHLAD